MITSWSRRLLLPALSSTLALAAAPASATKRAHVMPQGAPLIKPLLAAKVGDAVCFSGTFTGAKVHVRDYAKATMVPVPGLFRFGEPVMRPEPYVYVGQELKTMTLVLRRDARAHEDWDEMHDFRLEITLQDWQAPLRAAGECPMRLTNRPVQGARDPSSVNTTTLWCSIDCDGGAMEVERVPGKWEVIFRFNASTGGLRMSEGCSGGQSYQVGGAAKPYAEQPQKDFVPTPFRLSRMPAELCTAYRKAIAR